MPNGTERPARTVGGGTPRFTVHRDRNGISTCKSLITVIFVTTIKPFYTLCFKDSRITRNSHQQTSITAGPPPISFADPAPPSHSPARPPLADSPTRAHATPGHRRPPQRSGSRIHWPAVWLAWAWPQARRKPSLHCSALTRGTQPYRREQDCDPLARAPGSGPARFGIRAAARLGSTRLGQRRARGSAHRHPSGWGQAGAPRLERARLDWRPGGSGSAMAARSATVGRGGQALLARAAARSAGAAALGAPPRPASVCSWMTLLAVPRRA